MRENALSNLLVKLMVGTAVIGASTIALAEAPGAPAVENSQATLPEKIVSDGSRFVVSEQEMAITPPAGWEVLTRSSGLSLIMQEPRVEAPSYTKPKYQRNITVATVQRPSPIDEQRAASLKEELTKTFGKPGMSSNFQIVEHKFFDYRGKKDGLVVYSSMQLGEFQMMQMHVLISGEARQYVMTYTDLASEFAANNAAYEKAWNSMVSIDVVGKAPVRYMEYVPYGIAGGVAFLLFTAIGFLRRRSASRGYAHDANEIYSDDGVVASGNNSNAGFTVSGIWSLDADQDLHLSQPARSHVSHISKAVEFASSYS